MKVINFNYKGGKDSISFNINPSSLPIRYELDKICNWLNVSIICDTITIEAKPTYDYKSRSVKLSVFNSNNNQIDLEVKQDGFDGIDLQCNNTIVLHHSYFDMNEYYNFYVTVYGGETQELICNKIQPSITKVWDNSDMYNDFIIKIPRGLHGKYTLKHSEYSRYKKYCKDNDIPFDEHKVKREIEIIQVNVADTIGEMVLLYKGNQYKTFDVVPITIENLKPIEIEILSTKYMHQISLSKYEIIDTKQVELGQLPDWIRYEMKDNKIILSSNGQNNFETRKFRIKITNKTNSHQYVFLDIKQESWT